MDAFPFSKKYLGCLPAEEIVAWSMPLRARVKHMPCGPPPCSNGCPNKKMGKIPKRAPHLRVLWLTPLRALVEDTTRTLEELNEGLSLP